MFGSDFDSDHSMAAQSTTDLNLTAQRYPEPRAARFRLATMRRRTFSSGTGLTVSPLINGHALEGHARSDELPAPKARAFLLLC